jgi:hypothetical protein
MFIGHILSLSGVWSGNFTLTHLKRIQWPRARIYPYGYPDAEKQGNRQLFFMPILSGKLTQLSGDRAQANDHPARSAGNVAALPHKR